MYSTASKQYEKSLKKQGLRIVDFGNSFTITQRHQDKIREYLGAIYCGGVRASMELFNALVQNPKDLELINEEMEYFFNPDC